MLFWRLKKFFILIFCLFAFSMNGEEKPFVVGSLSCELGNNLFQVAATCAHAWDHGAEPLFPDLVNRVENGMPLNHAHVFFRCSSRMPRTPILYSWQLPIASNFCYTPIPYKPNMLIAGTFQSEKFFLHHRERLLNLFTPHPKDLAYIKDKYGEILKHPLTVGIQVRWFGRKHDEPWNKYLVQYGYDYFSRAVALFPENALFIVSSNNKEFARQNLPKTMKNVIFLENEPYYIDFFILSMCKHQIISNSSFGWWTAWLNRNPEKIVITPQEWIDPKWHDMTPVKDVWPESWIQIDAQWEKPSAEPLSH